MVNFGFIGTGRMAKKMANELKKMAHLSDYELINLHSVYSRSSDNGKAFRDRYGFDESYHDIESFLSDDSLDVVYIVSPTSEHFWQTKRALEKGLACLVEKAFTANYVQAKEVVSISEKRHILVAEAMWARYQPMFKKIRSIIDSGIIGEAKLIYASLCYPVMYKERVSDISLAGGALLDVGIYAISFADVIFGEVDNISLSASFKGNVDASEAVILTHKNGRISVLISSVESMSDGIGYIYCEDGYIIVDNVNNYKVISVFDNYKRMLQKYTSSESNLLGYEYEIKEVLEALKNGSIECPSMRHGDTLRMMKLCDKIREKMNYKFPFEGEMDAE